MNSELQAPNNPQDELDQAPLTPEEAIKELQMALVKTSEVFLTEITSLAKRVGKLENNANPEERAKELEGFKKEIQGIIDDAINEQG